MANSSVDESSKEEKIKAPSSEVSTGPDTASLRMSATCPEDSVVEVCAPKRDERGKNLGLFLAYEDTVTGEILMTNTLWSDHVARNW